MQYRNAWEERRMQLICPVDRTPVDKDKVLTKIADFEVKIEPLPDPSESGAPSQRNQQ